MKKRLLMPTFPLKMNLQLFAEGGEGGSGDGSNGGTSTNSQQGQQSQDNDQQSEGGEDNQGNGKTFSRDDVAKMIAAETTKAVTAAEEKWRNEKAEAEKLAEMNEKDKADYERQKLEEKIAEYERKDNLAKMSEKASEMLSDKGAVPTKEILSLIVMEDAESTSNNVKTYLAAIEQERESIKADFEKRLGGKVPLDGTGSTSLSRGAQMAKEANNQAKQPENDPWSI